MKVVSDTVFAMINVVYHCKSLVLIGPRFREKLASHHHRAVNEVDSCLLIRRAGSKAVAFYLCLIMLLIDYLYSTLLKTWCDSGCNF